MNQTEIRSIVEASRKYFSSGDTIRVNHRIYALKRLKSCILKYEKEILAALEEDLGKSAYEGYMCEVGLVLSEITYMLRHIRAFSGEKTVRTPLSQFSARSFKKPSPYGVVLIMSPWNYPFLLTMEPLVDALAAGNTAIIKPSAYSVSTSAVIHKIINECFRAEYVTVVCGGRVENQCLLEQHFDYIFFTGSQSVGKEVMKKASDYLTPVTLELGGKSPCIVDRTADIPLAARRIVFGKFLNCGQTCVAPDYIYCDRTVHDELVKALCHEISVQYGQNALNNKGYGKIINDKHFQRLCNLLDENKIVWGGNKNELLLKIEPTVMDHVTFNDPVMKEEIFGPILPIVTFNSLQEAVKKINSMEHPLALYMFTRSRKNARIVMSRCGFGGGCINDTIIHLATSEMGFGGFGESGMGSYHGKDGFLTFSHTKSIVNKKLWIDLPMRYQPYKKFNEKLLHLFLK